MVVSHSGNFHIYTSQWPQNLQVKDELKHEPRYNLCVQWNPWFETEEYSTLWKHCHLPSTPFPYELQNCSTCSTSPFLSCLYKYWTKTCNSSWYGEKSNSSVPKSIFYNSDSTLLLIPKSYATSSQNQVIAHRATKVTLLCHNWPWIFQMQY